MIDTAGTTAMGADMGTQATHVDAGRTTVVRWWWLIALGAAVALIWTMGSADQASAVPTGPGVIELEQPDGTTFEAQQFGDEWYHGVETSSGHTILRRGGWWFYAARRTDGSLRATDLRVTQDRPTMRKHLRDSVKTRRAAARRDELAQVTHRSTEESGQHKVAATGSDPVLVILVRFQDQAPLGTTATSWSNRYFGSGRSVADYYRKNSYDKFTFTPAAESHGADNNGVVGWLSLPISHPDWDDVERPVIRDAIKAADPYVDYASFDTNGDGTVQNTELHINVVMAGLEESVSGNDHGNSIWANRWYLDGPNTPTVDGKKVGNSGFLTYGEMQRVQLKKDGPVDTHQATVGVIVHELGHDLSIPDLYDTDGSSSGIGDWSVMAGGSWNRAPSDPELFIGATPSMFDAWSRWTLGWITPDHVTGVERTTLRAASTGTPTNTTAQLLANPDGPDWISRDDPGSGRYFLVENRQQTGYDTGLPGSGLLILEVDESYKSNTTNNLIRVIESDGNDLIYRENRGDPEDVWSGPKPWYAESNRAAVSQISASGDVMNASFTAEPGTPPANDAFATPQVLQGWTPARVRTTNAFATTETGEPIHVDPADPTWCRMGSTVWYRYTPPADGMLTVDLAGSDRSPVLALWRGTAKVDLAPLGCDDGTADAKPVLRDVPVSKDQTYYVQVGAWIDKASRRWWGDVSLSVRLRPANDDRARARVVPGPTFSHAISTGTATTETDEPRNAACPAISRSVWYSYRPAVSGVLAVDTAGSSFDTVAAVWQSSRGVLTPLACDAGGVRGGLAAVGGVQVQAGRTYLVQAGGSTTSGLATRSSLSVSTRVTAANDQFAQAFTLNGTDTSSASFTTNASKETGESAHAGTGVGRSVWWSWTAPRSGPVTFDTDGSVGDTVLAVYTGGSVDGLTQIAADGDVTDGPSGSVTFAAVSGQTYRIAVDNLGTASGDVRLQVDEHTDLVTDLFVDDVPGTTTFTYDVNVSRVSGASTEPVVVDLVIPSSLAFGTLPPGCTTDRAAVSARCDLGLVDPDGRANVEVPVEPRNEGPHVATLSLVTLDNDPAGNTASAAATPEFLCDNDFTTFVDVVVGTDGDDILCGGGGADRITGGRGNDKIFGGAGTDTAAYDGADASMTFDLAVQDGRGAFARSTSARLRADGTDAASSIEAVVATAFADLVNGRSAAGRDIGADLIYSGGGDDVVNALGGPDTVHSGDGNDAVDGGAGNDQLHGEVGDDVLLGGDGDDDLYGDAGSDRLTGGAGADDLDGGADTDTCADALDSQVGCEL